MDLITDFEFPDGPHVRRALQRRARAIGQMFERAREARLPVIYANDNLGPWRSDAPSLVARCTRPGRTGSKLVASLAPAADDCIVLKPRHSAFFATPLAVLLDDLDIGTLILTGVSAESCVWITACDAHMRGLALVVPGDTIAGASARALRTTLISLRQVLGARTPARSAELRFSNGRLR